MCDDLVERVARAIYTKAWGIDLALRMKECKDLTRAAIEAIEDAGYVVVPREPTPDMRLAGGMAWMKAYDACFKAMIDAALEKDKANVG